MGTKTEELIQTLDEILAILEDDGESHWLRWITESKRRLLNSDYSGIEHLLGAYGGMGSFNDFGIGQIWVNGEIKWKPGGREKDNRFQALRSRAYELADFIKHNHEITGTPHKPTRSASDPTHPDNGN